MKPALKEFNAGIEMKFCQKCGAPSSRTSCGTCRKLESLSSIQRVSVKQEKGRKLNCATTKQT